MAEPCARPAMAALLPGCTIECAVACLRQGKALLQISRQRPRMPMHESSMRGWLQVAWTTLWDRVVR